MTRNDRADEFGIPSIAMGPELIRLLTILHRARLPVLIEGPHGIGKSESVEAAARELGIACLVVDLSLLEPSDLVGLPDKRDGLTRFVPPSFLPREGRGLLVLEELNRCAGFMQAPALQLLTLRRLNDYVLPDGWSVVACINPEDGEYDVQSMCLALRDRFWGRRAHADREAWLEWARERGHDEGVLEAVAQHDRALTDVSPRSWTNLARLLATLSDEERRDEHLVAQLALGYLPPPWVTLFLEASALSATPGLFPRELLRSYHRDPEQRQALEALRRAGRTDALEAVYRQLHALVSGPELSSLIDSGAIDLGAFERLLEDLAGDLREGLQEGFGENPAAVGLLPVGIAPVLDGLARRTDRRHIKSWADTRGLEHRARALVTAAARHVEDVPNAPVLRRNRRAVRGLQRLVADVGIERSRRLLDALQKQGIDPLES